MIHLLITDFDSHLQCVTKLPFFKKGKELQKEVHLHAPYIY